MSGTAASRVDPVPIDLSDVPGSLRPAAAAALRAAGVAEGHLSVELVSERRIRELNRLHRGLDEPTDVLSFPVDGRGAVPGPRELGDVVVCPARTADLRRATVHAVLHLCGYDHEADDGGMLDLEDAVMRSISPPGEVPSGLDDPR
jgi:probable rRNA maturation factor